MLMMLALCWIGSNCRVFKRQKKVSSKTEFQLMLMMLALRFAELAQ